MDKLTREQFADLTKRCQMLIEQGKFHTDHIVVFTVSVYVELLEGIISQLSERLASINHVEEMRLCKTFSSDEKTKLINSMLTEELRKGLI